LAEKYIHRLLSFPEELREEEIWAKHNKVEQEVVRWDPTTVGREQAATVSLAPYTASTALHADAAHTSLQDAPVCDPRVPVKSPCGALRRPRQHLHRFSISWQPKSVMEQGLGSPGPSPAAE